MVIDFHAHWLPDELARALRDRSTPPYIATSEAGEQFHMPVGALPFDHSYSDLSTRITQMDREGVAQQVLSLPCLFGLDTRPAREALPLLEIFNSATAEAAAAHPTRFCGLASLPFADIDLAAKTYQNARRELGLMGAIVPINYFLTIKGVEEIAPLLEMANREGGHLFLHPGRRAAEAEGIDAQGTGRYADSIMARRQLEIQHEVSSAMVTLLWGEIAQKYPDLTFHVANIGGTLPMVVERMDFTSKLRTHEPVLPSKRLRDSGIYVDCSSMGPVAITAAVACFGAENILFGSDTPIYNSDWQQEALRNARISEGERAAISHNNAARLLSNKP